MTLGGELGLVEMVFVDANGVRKKFDHLSGFGMRLGLS